MRDFAAVVERFVWLLDDDDDRRDVMITYDTTVDSSELLRE